MFRFPFLGFNTGIHMTSFLAFLFRNINTFLIKFKATYLLGMVLVRFSRFLKKRFNKKGVDMRTVNNFMGTIKMCVDRNSYMGGSIYWTGFHHLNELLFLNSFLKPDMVFIDIGANQGEFSLFAASKLTNGKVVSFEPVAKQLGYFENNIKINSFKNIELNAYGLSNEEGSLPIYTSLDTTLHSGIHEGLSTLYATGNRAAFEQNVALKVFDKEYINRFSRIDFIKIDIEGAELYALKGMQQHLSQFKPTILIEMNDDTFKAAGYSLPEMSDYLKSFGYKPYRIFRGEIFKIEENEVFANWGNYIFKV
jgi:FkbM family methyltransferase